VLAPEGKFPLVMPAEDDLAELREAVLGLAVPKDRGAQSLRASQGHFEVGTEPAALSRIPLDAAGLEDLLQRTYPGARYSERKPFAAAKDLEVTRSYRIPCFKYKGGSR
jgi:hypothetical protein